MDPGQTTSVGPATPFADVAEAIQATLHRLVRQGLGSWDVVDARLDDLTDVDHLLIPILLPDGTLLGLRATPAGETELGLAEGPDSVLYAARVLATILSAHGQIEQWRNRATKAEAESLTDDLTGLLNARGWQRALHREAARCTRHELDAVVAVIDLDDLKVVNDTQGHLGGDLLLRSAASILAQTVRASDIVARIGGDEFAVLAVDYEGPRPDLLLERLRRSFAATAVRASCGGAVYHPGDAVADVFKRADADMYTDKTSRRRDGAQSFGGHALKGPSLD